MSAHFSWKVYIRLCLRGFAQHVRVHKVENNVQAHAHPLGVKRSGLGSWMSLGVSGSHCEPHYNGKIHEFFKGWGGGLGKIKNRTENVVMSVHN